MAHERGLRIVTSFTTAFATPLLIACTIVIFKETRSRYPWSPNQRIATIYIFPYIAIALTASASIIGLMHYRRHGRMPDFRFALLDLLAAITYLAILIPIWATARSVPLGLLVGYATAPMIFNMVVHAYIFMCNAKSLCSWMFSKPEHECPNCRSKFTEHTPFTGPTTQVQQTTSNGGERYSLLRGEDYLDEDAVPYTGGRTSEDQVGVAGDADVEDKGKGSIKI